MTKKIKKIITLGISLSDEHKKRLTAAGELMVLENPTSVEDFLKKSDNADIIYSNGDYLLASLPKLKNVFVTYPYIELGAFNTEELGKNGVIVANAQGGNKDSIVEWVIYMALSLFRKFGPFVRATENIPVELQESLHDKKVLIIGHGSIGSQIGILFNAFGMKVTFFNRGDNLAISSKNSDLIINSLNCNSTSKNLLNESFFMNLKKDCYYITFARPYTYDIDGLIKSINGGLVAGAAIDCDPEKFGDTKNEFYQKALSNPKILVTPHIAFSTKQAVANGREIAIQNIESFVVGEPKNILKKK
jgi:phosphoglycerate dehydrogenase-like enzyme